MSLTKMALWLVVVVPLGWGVWHTAQNAALLFN